MATLRLFGPFTWARVHGENYLRPGDQHYWQWGPARAPVLGASAHASSRQSPNETVAVNGLSVTYPGSGDPFLNLLVVNAGASSIGVYRFYVSEVDFT